MSDVNFSEWMNLNVDDFIKQLNKLEQIEDKISKMLQYMKFQLNHGDIHPLSKFWKMRKFCLDHFKETIAVSHRLRLWKDYCQTIEEIIKLKELVDEKSSFEKEQIEDALSSIFQELDDVNTVIEKEPAVQVPKSPAVAQYAEFYQATQKELAVYSSYAKKLNALKKEILALDISFKKKQEILDQIHALADRVFPRKRELLNLISSHYSAHINQFVKAHFSSSEFSIPTFQLKEQIKQLQTFAKSISLNVESFSKTREQLSKCWDQLKTFEKEQKKLKEQKKEQSTELFNHLQEKIENLKSANQSQNLAENIDQLHQKIKHQDLLKHQKKQLFDQLDELQQSNQDSSESIEDQDNSILELLDELTKKSNDLSFISLNQAVRQIIDDFDVIGHSETIELSYQKKLLELRQKQQALIEMQEPQNIEGDLAHELNLFIEDVKLALENYRKASCSSNHSIEKAMLYNQLISDYKLMISQLERFNSHQV